VKKAAAKKQTGDKQPKCRVYTNTRVEIVFDMGKDAADSWARFDLVDDGVAIGAVWASADQITLDRKHLTILIDKLTKWRDQLPQEGRK